MQVLYHRLQDGGYDNTKGDTGGNSVAKVTQASSSDDAQLLHPRRDALESNAGLCFAALGHDLTGFE